MRCVSCLVKYDNDSWPLVKPPSLSPQPPPRNPFSLIGSCTAALSLVEPARLPSDWPRAYVETSPPTTMGHVWGREGGRCFTFSHHLSTRATFGGCPSAARTDSNLSQCALVFEAGHKVSGSLPRPVWPLPISCSRADRAAQASATNTTLLAQPEPDLRTAEERGER